MVKRNVFFLLLLLLLVATLKLGSQIWFHFFLIAFVGVVVDLIFLWFRKIPFFFPWAALVTALVITLVLDPASSVVFLIITPVLTITAKHLLRKSGRHVFNPAGLGLFLAALAGAPISWWVGSSGWLVDVLLIIGAFFSLGRLGRLPIVLAFFTTFFLVKLLVYQEITLWFSLFFFPLIMLPEPLTSPADFREQLIYGSLAAIGLIFFGFRQWVLVDSLLQSLLLVNLFHSFGLIRKVSQILPWP